MPPLEGACPCAAEPFALEPPALPQVERVALPERAALRLASGQAQQQRIVLVSELRALALAALALERVASAQV